jgi:hypothetical protein
MEDQGLAKRAWYARHGIGDAPRSSQLAGNPAGDGKT